MNTKLKLILSTLTLALASFGAAAQAMFFNSASVPDETTAAESVAEPTTLPQFPDSVRTIEGLDYYLSNPDSIAYDTLVVIKPLPDIFFGPVVYDTFEFADTASVFATTSPCCPKLRRSSTPW